MTEAEMEAADPKELAAKVKKAEDILYQVIKTFQILLNSQSYDET